MQVMNKMLNVELAERSYPIHIGVGVLTQAELILPYIKQKKVVVVDLYTLLWGYSGRTAILVYLNTM